MAVEGLLFSVLTDRPLTYVSGVEHIFAVIVAIPYLMLAGFNVRTLRPWLMGLFLTLSLWSFALYSRVSSARNPSDESGENLVLLILLFLSPLYISAAVMATYATRKTRRLTW